MNVQQYFTSQKNYLKRHPSSGSTSMPAPSTLIAGYLYRSSITIPHNLGYIPKVRVYFENSVSDGKVYPAGGRRLAGTYPGLPFTGMYCLWEVTTTDLTIYLESSTAAGPQTGNRTVYWVIYWDTV